jgi:hypothetical protein
VGECFDITAASFKDKKIMYIDEPRQRIDTSPKIKYLFVVFSGAVKRGGEEKRKREEKEGREGLER